MPIKATPPVRSRPQLRMASLLMDGVAEDAVVAVVAVVVVGSVAEGEEAEEGQEKEGSTTVLTAI